MAHLVCENRLTFLSSRHKEILNEYFRQAHQTAQPRDLVIQLGIDYPQVIAILAVLAADGYCHNWLLIYHSCSETFVDSIPLRMGMPKLPYICPYCEIEIDDYDELKLDVMAETKTSVEFI